MLNHAIIRVQCVLDFLRDHSLDLRGKPETSRDTRRNTCVWTDYMKK